MGPNQSFPFPIAGKLSDEPLQDLTHQREGMIRNMGPCFCFNLIGFIFIQCFELLNFEFQSLKFLRPTWVVNELTRPWRGVMS